MMPRPRRIAFVINSLAGGGAERVFCRLIEGLAEPLSAWDTDVYLLDDEPPAYVLPSFARVHSLNSHRGALPSFARLLGALRSAKPDVAVSFLTRANCATVLAAQRLGFPTVISERVATADHFGRGPGGVLKRLVTGEAYRRADAIIAVSQGVKHGLVAQCGVRSDKIDVIPNPVDAPRIKALALEPPQHRLPEKAIVCVCRLAANKNVAMLIEALARSGLPHHLLVLGEGPERSALAQRARALGLGERVHFLGFLSNPFSVMARAEMFASASNAEGFPNALAEALALGLPSVFTNCRAGPAEILADDAALEISAMHPARYGVLTPVGDVEALAEALRFLATREQRMHYRRRALERGAAYEPSAVFKRYWRVISRVLDARSSPSAVPARRAA
jgi:glycosyltransferase involved in cell wall biosynthesis